MSFDWSNLKEDCVFEVAREIARGRLFAYERADTTLQHERWHALIVAAREEAEDRIAGMNGLELLDLISSVVRSAEQGGAS